MTEEERKQAEARFAARMLQDFIPATALTAQVNADARAAHALEYIAFQLGRIRKKLEGE